MSDNLQKSDKAGSRWAWKNLKGRFLVISILFHILLAAVATYLVVQTFTPRKQTFKPGPKAAANKAVEHKINMVKKQNTMSAPATQRITTKGISKVVLPDMPVVPAMNPSAATMGSMGVAGASFSGGGAPGGVGAGGSPFFGLNLKSDALVGTFFDLKQTADRKPTRIATEAKPGLHDLGYEEVVQRFTRGGFKPVTFASYFRGPNPIYASQIFIPGIKATDGPKAFGLEKDVQPSRWVVVYSGRVRAPETGNFRFVGWADDVLVVRFDGRVVLDASFAQASSWKPKDVYNYNFPHKGFAYRGFRAGNWMGVTAGKDYDVDIIIGESPGGDFFAQLLMEKQGATYQKDRDGNPILPIFRVAKVPPPDVSRSNGSVPIAPDGPVWQALERLPVR